LQTRSLNFLENCIVELQAGGGRTNRQTDRETDDR